jgi:hypothetical protein
VAKQDKGKRYIFSVAMTNSASQPRFTLESLTGAEALVLGEKRSVAITQGVFVDAFDGYGVHIYEIPLASEGN